MIEGSIAPWIMTPPFGTPSQRERSYSMPYFNHIVKNSCVSDTSFKPDNTNAYPCFGMSSWSQRYADWQKRRLILAINRRKGADDLIKLCFLQQEPRNIVLVWSHSLIWDIILSQTWRVETNLHGTSSSGFAKSRTTGRASGMDSCRLCIYYSPRCLGSSECLFSPWIDLSTFRSSSKHFRRYLFEML